MTNCEQTQYRQAIAHYEQAIAAEPHHWPHYWQLGLAWFLLGEVEEAQGIWLAAMTQMSVRASQQAIAQLQQLLESVAAHQFRTGAYELAASLHRQILELEPEQPTLYLHLGDALAQQGQFDEALVCWQTAADLQPTRAEAFLRQATLYQQLSQWQAAIAQYEQALHLQPEHPAAHAGLAFCLGQVQNWAAALPHWQAAADWGNGSYALLQLGDLPGALARLHQQVQTQPAAIALVQAWQTRRADATCQFLTALMQGRCADPSAALPYQLLGQMLDQAGEGERAIAAYQQSLQCPRPSPQPDPDPSQPGWAALYWRMGQSWARLQRWEAAIASYQTAIQLCSEFAPAYLDLGKARYQQGQWAAAEFALAEAQRLQPQEVEVVLHQGNCWAAQQQWERAIAAYQTYLQSHPQTAIVWCNLGVAQAQVGQRGEAIASFARTMQLNNNLAPNIWHWMVTFQQQGRLSAADPGFVTTLPVAPPVGFYATTADWAATTTSADPTAAYQPIFPAQTLSLYPPKTPTGEIHVSFRFGASVPLPGSFVASIPEGRFWIDPDQSSSAILTGDNALLTDLSPEFPALSPGHPDKFPGQHWLFVVEKLQPVQYLEGSVAVLAGLSTHVYFHWMFDLLPRVELLRQAGIDLGQIDYFLAGDRHSFQRETLQTLGIPPHKILPLEHYDHLQARQLIVPSFPGSVAWMPAWVCAWLKQTFLPPAAERDPLPKPHPQRLYISRNQTATRRLLNEQQVVQLLEAYGFRSVQLETLSVSEQASLFATADAVVAVHGSGLTNLVFCPPGTKVIEIFSPNFVYSCYWLVSCLSGLEYYYLLGELPLGFYFHRLLYPDARTEDVVVDCDRLQEMLEFAGLGLPRYG